MPAQYRCEEEVMLEDSDDGYDEKNFQPAKPRRCFFITILVASIILVILLYNIIRVNLIPSLELESTNCSCGTSIAEALTKNCRWDSISTAWYPPACRDDSLIDEFNWAGPGINGSWAYYREKDDTILSVEQVSLLAGKAGDEVLFWTTHEWHIAQCLFFWKKEAKAWGLGLGLSRDGGNGESRFAHCIDVLRTHKPLDEINTVSRAILS
jgi:hypothetical protein